MADEKKTAAKPTAKAADKDMIKVELKKGSSYRQPSTGIVINKAINVVEMKNDAWLKLQISAGLLAEVK